MEAKGECVTRRAPTSPDVDCEDGGLGSSSLVVLCDLTGESFNLLTEESVLLPPVAACNNCWEEGPKPQGPRKVVVDP